MLEARLSGSITGAFVCGAVIIWRLIFGQVTQT
jgi:hypothetical protein